MILSVVVPTYNKVELLRQTLAALGTQEIESSEPWEVVVVDDGSSDGTSSFLSELDGTGSRPVLKAVCPGHNVGRARARNLGAQAAQGRWILFLDDDIVAPPGLLQAHLKLLQKFPGQGTIGFAVTEPQVADAPHFAYLDSRGVAKLQEGPAPARFFVTQNAAVPREAFLAVGGFDEDFSAYGFEDMEVAFRLADEAGIHFRALQEPVPLHVHHHTLDQYLDKKVECGRKSLPHLAGLHPRRIPEMKLHHVVDFPGQGQISLLSRMIRLMARGFFPSLLRKFLLQWPCRSHQRPWWPRLYFKIMDLMVLISLRQGVRDHDRQALDTP